MTETVMHNHNHQEDMMTQRETSMVLKADFEERFAHKRAVETFRKIKHDIEEGRNLEAAALHIGASGLEVGQTMMLSVWTQLQLLSALLGGLSMTVFVTSPGLNSLFSSSSTLTNNQAKCAACCFYLFWALATFFELAALVLVTIAQLHYSLMLDSLDALWFIETWKLYVWTLPRAFVVTGCACVVLGCISAIFIIADNIIASIVAIIGLGFMIVISYIWIVMLKANIARKQQNVQRCKNTLFEVLVADTSDSASKTV